MITRKAVLRLTSIKSTCARLISNGMNFEFTSEQVQLRGAVRKFVQDEIVPLAAHFDRTMEFPFEVLKKLLACGYMNVDIPAANGGLELDMLSNVMIAEEIGFGCTGVGASVAVNHLASTPLILAGSDHIKKRFLGRMTEQLTMAAYCVTEPSAGSDVAAIRTKCEKKGDEYVINGSKMWITNAGVANWYFVLARSDPDPKCPTGKSFTAFVVDAETPGIVRGKKEVNMGQRCSDTRSVTFEDVRVPSENVVGSPGEGFKIVMRTFDRTRPMMAALAVGLHARCLHEATKYAIERKAFGTPIANHQAIQFILANMAMQLELSRLMTYKAARAIDLGRRGSYHSCIAKCFAADAASQAASDCVQVFGGAGYNTEYPAEKLMRDAKILQIYGGTSQIQRVVIARELIARMKESGQCS